MIEVRPPDTQSMKDLPIHNEDLVDREFGALPHGEEMMENQGSVAKSS